MEIEEGVRHDDMDAQILAQTTASEEGVGHDNMNAHILARTTAEQERKTRWVRCALALVGVSFPDSAWYVYALQVVGLGTQGFVLIYLIYAEDQVATYDDIDDEVDVQAQTNMLLRIFIQVFPWCFLCYLTRSHERHTLNDMVKNLTMPWWMYVLPFVANLATCVENAAIPGQRAFWFFVGLITWLPASMSILPVFAYVLEFEKQLPTIESIEDIKDKVLRYETTIQDKIFKINVGLIIPNVLFWLFLTLDSFWYMVDYIKYKYYYEAVLYGFITVFNFLFALTFLLPPVYHTYVMNKFVSTLDKTYCGEDAGNVLPWLKDKESGWKTAYILISPMLLARICYVVGAAILTTLARLL